MERLAMEKNYRAAWHANAPSGYTLRTSTKASRRQCAGAFRVSRACNVLAVSPAARRVHPQPTHDSGADHRFWPPHDRPCSQTGPAAWQWLVG
jgi:hypothetical protein